MIECIWTCVNLCTQAAQALWITILRFTGDLSEPRYHTMDRDTTSVMSKVTATLGRNFIRSKEFQEAQMMGMDPVSLLFMFLVFHGTYILGSNFMPYMINHFWFYCPSHWAQCFWYSSWNKVHWHKIWAFRRS